MKKVLGSLIITSVALLLVACDGKEKEVTDVSIKDRYELDATKPAWQLDKKEETTEIVWYMNSDWTFLPFGEDITSKKIKEDLNINVKFISGDDAKLNAMISSGDMPDIVTLHNKVDQAAVKAASWAQPLNELAEKYDPYFMEVIDEGTFKWYSLDDGNTYGYPNFSNTEADYKSGNVPTNDNFVIREDVYEAIGKPDMSTEKGFLDSIAAIKKQFPEMIPFGFPSLGTTTGPFNEKLQDFIGVPLETEDGKFYDRNLDDEYINWMRAINKIYQAGSISDDSFTDDGPTFDEKVRKGDYASLFIAGTSGQGTNMAEFINNTGTRFIAIDAFASPSGREIGLNQTGISGWLSNYITKGSKDPAKAIQIFTYLISPEGQILTKFGIEGESFAYNADGKIDILPEIKELEAEDNQAYVNKYGLGQFLYFNNDRVNALGVNRETPLTQLQWEWGAGKLKPHFIVENIQPDAGTPEARSNEAIETKLNSIVVSLIRSKDDAAFDKTLNEYKEFLDKNNWDKIKEIKSEKMAENREKLTK